MFLIAHFSNKLLSYSFFFFFFCLKGNGELDKWSGENAIYLTVVSELQRKLNRVLEIDFDTFWFSEEFKGFTPIIADKSQLIKVNGYLLGAATLPVSFLPPYLTNRINS